MERENGEVGGRMKKKEKEVGGMGSRGMIRNREGREGRRRK